MEQMPRKLAEVLVLAYYHRFAYKDIAEIVGIPLGTVKSRLHAAIVCFGSAYREAVGEQAREN
jgi:RNA polymerase sigma-70 factor (ECF subfamily)